MSHHDFTRQPAKRLVDMSHRSDVQESPILSAGKRERESRLRQTDPDRGIVCAHAEELHFSIPQFSRFLARSLLFHTHGIYS